MHPMLNIAVQAARKAGKLCLHAHARSDEIKITYKENGEISSNIDQACEKTIIDTIRKHHPNHGIVAEESGGMPSSEEDTPTWIIDPIDGSRNFVHGHPHIAIAIAVQIKQRIDFALIYDPFRDELFTAERGRGAQKDGKRIRVPAHVHTALPQALVGIGSASRHMMATPIAEQCGAIRVSGSACLDFAYIASGRLDAILQNQLRIWDIAAGILIAQEAGIVCSDFQGNTDMDALFSGNIVAAPAKMHAALLPLCQTLGHKKTQPNR